MSLQFARSLTELFKLNSETRLDDALLNRILAAIELRLKPLETQRGDLDSAIGQVRQVGLDRINEVLTPAIASVLEIQERGFLIARSSSSATLAGGSILTFVIGDEAERALFTPSPFTALTREATPDDYGIARTIAYDVETGEYICEVLSVAGDPGPHGDWVIGALAGPTIAMLDVLGQVLEALADATSAATTATTKAGEATGAAAAAAADATTASDAADAAAASAAAAATFDPAAFAPKASPALTGTPTAPTAAGGTSTTQLATTAFVQTAIAALVASAPGALDTLNELAAALGNDANFAATVTNALALKAPLASPALTGTPTAPTAAGGTSTTQLATTAFVQAAITALVASAPGALDTLNELAAALGNDANFATTVTNALATKASLTGAETLSNKTLVDPAITGTVLEDIFAIVDAAAFEIDPGNGSIQTVTLGANRTPKATNMANGESVTLAVDDGTAFTLTWTDATFGGTGVKWLGGTAPTLATTGLTWITLWKLGGQVYGASPGNSS